MEEKEPQGADRRVHTRVSVKTSVTLSSETNFYTGFSQNISEGGLFVATHNLMSMGTIVDLEFMLPGDKVPLKVQGEVCWIREYNPSTEVTPGMGLRFIDLDEKTHKRVEDFVKKRETLFYDD